MEEKNNSCFTPEQGEPKKPKKNKKPNLKLSKRTVSAIYMGVALCMIAVLAVSVVNTTDRVKSNVDKLGEISLSVPDISFSMPQGDTPTKPSTQDKPAGSDVSGVTGEIEEPDNSTKEESKTPVISYVRPLKGEIIKGYYMDSLVFSETMQDYRTHSGVDIAADLGTPVVAYSDGVIRSITEDPFMGTTVEIEHKAGLVSVYKNLAPILAGNLSVGDAVNAGDEIGAVGESAIAEIADPPHLHFEVWMNGDIVDAEKEIATL